MPEEKELHSTGRGGSGNIGTGEGEYADAAILSDGNPAPKKNPTEEHSTGRGGQGNIVHDSAAVKGGEAPTEDGAQYADYHTGRGGEGNIHREKFGGHSKPPKEHLKEGHGAHGGLVEKAKHAVGLDRSEVS